MTDFTAIVVAIYFCGNALVGPNDTCIDGSPQQSGELFILHGEQLDCNYKEKSIDEFLRSCIREWKSVIEIQRNKQTIFLLKPDGKIEHTTDFTVDAAGEIFWKTIVDGLLSRIK